MGERGPRPGHARRAAPHVLALVLLGLLACVADRSAQRDGPAFDEPLHLAAGTAYLATGDFRLDLGTGVLPQMWAALPIWHAGASLDVDASAWASSDVWLLGNSLLYGSGRDPAGVLRPARRMVLALALALGAVVYAWSWRLYGPGGALISLALYSVCPNLLAHARLVTSDVATALAFCVAVGAAIWMLARPHAGRVVPAGVAAGLLLLCKATSLLLLPMLGLLAAWRIAAATPERRAATLGCAVGLLAVALLVIWLAHGLAFRPGAGAPPALDWARVESAPGLFPALLGFARDAQLLPETWLHGVGFAFATTRDRVAFAAGSVGAEGWWWYFPWCVLVKTPLGTLGIFGLASCAGLRSWWRRREAQDGESAHGVTAPLWILLGVYGVASMASQLNIGIRHLLPMLPAAMILAGASVRWCDTRWGRVAVPVLVAAAALESLAVYPHYLSFFNRAFGGPAAGYRLLVDSNLDWGQDLPALGTQLAAQRAGGDAAPCYLSYFGSALPERHGVECARLPGFFEAPPALRAATLGPGLYFVSATMLQGLYLEPELRGAWGAPQETRLAALEALLASLEGEHPEAPQLEQLRLRMRFVKLLAALRARAPDVRVAYSILGYRVGREDLAGVGVR